MFLINLSDVMRRGKADKHRARLEYLSVFIEGLAGPGLKTERVSVRVLQHHVLPKSIECVSRTVKGVDVWITKEPT